VNLLPVVLMSTFQKYLLASTVFRSNSTRRTIFPRNSALANVIFIRVVFICRTHYIIIFHGFDNFRGARSPALMNKF
jgi:hypothetical protein